MAHKKQRKTIVSPKNKHEPHFGHNSNDNNDKPKIIQDGYVSRASSLNEYYLRIKQAKMGELAKLNSKTNCGTNTEYAILGEQYPNHTICEIFQGIYVTMNEKYFMPLINTRTVEKIGKLESKYGRGTLMMIFDFPQDVKSNKLSNMAFIFGYEWMDKDDDIVFSDFTVWISKQKLQKFLHAQELIMINRDIDDFYNHKPCQQNHNEYSHNDIL